MYGAIWRLLPGPLWIRVLLVAALVAAVVTVCFAWVFPAVDAWTAPMETFGRH